MSAFLKLKGGPEVAQGMAHLGLPERVGIPLAILEVSCTVIYLIPHTSALGALLLAGYVGGTICTHWRAVGALLFHMALRIRGQLRLSLPHHPSSGLYPLVMV